MIKITTNTKSLELTGEETHVHFTTAFPYFWLRNDSSGTVLMSLSPNIEEGGDGVISVLAGSSAGTMHGYNSTCNDLYLSGRGKVQVMGTHTPENPFRNCRKGGDSITEIKELLKGTNDGVFFKNGSDPVQLTYANPGFRLINSLPAGISQIDTWSGIYFGALGRFALVFEKAGSLAYGGSNYIDSALFSSNEEVDLTNYNYILIDFLSTSNWSDSTFDNFGGAYFRIDEPENLPQSEIAYDWSDWDMLADNRLQGLFCKDISIISGKHKLCFGVCHGTYTGGYSNALGILNIILF